MELLQSLAVWVHVVSAVSSFGVVLALQIAIPRVLRSATSQPLLRFATGLLALAFLAGMATYYFAMTTAAALNTEIEASFHRNVGIKFLCLLGIGACLGIATAKARKSPDANTETLQRLALTLYGAATAVALIF